MRERDNKSEQEEDFSGLCVLLVEDNEIMRLSLEDRLRLEGLPVRCASDAASAYAQIEKGDVDLVVTDIRLPDGSGTDLFAYISRHHPGTPVILMTAYSDISDAVALVKAGAVDYLTKPFELCDFIDKMGRHLSRIRDVRLSTGSLGIDDAHFRPGAGVLGKSAPMRTIERLVARLSESDSSVLITGESGVGKEVVADLIHHNSLRAQGPLVKVNCAALPLGLIESELFGHEKGAFTGAMQRRIGRFEQAHGGTIFLDEIAEIPREIQVKLLRVLQELVIERVGGQESISLDVRVIAATQVDLDTAMKKGDFRSDLYWRLNVIHVHIPPLRERRDDILHLARIFVNQLAANTRWRVKGLSKEAELQLLSMSYPGNVRELKNIIERAIALCGGRWLAKNDLLIPGSMEAADDQEVTVNTLTLTLKESIKNAECAAIWKALEESGWIINKAAKSLAISRKSLWEKMKRYGIEK